MGFTPQKSIFMHKNTASIFVRGQFKSLCANLCCDGIGNWRLQHYALITKNATAGAASRMPRQAQERKG